MENKINPTDDARTQLLLTGMRLFAKNGMDGTSTREIAKEAQLNISLISYYFGGKEGLYKAVFEEFAGRMLTQMAAILAQIQYDKLNKESFRTHLSQLIDCVIEMKISHPEMAVLFQREVVSGLPFAKETHHKVYSTISNKVIALLQEAQKKKLIKSNINLFLFLSLMAESLNGFFLMHSCCPEGSLKQFNFPQDKEIFRDQVMEIFLQGITL